MVVRVWDLRKVSDYVLTRIDILYETEMMTRQLFLSKVWVSEDSVGDIDYKCEWNVIGRWIMIEEETNQGQLRKRIGNGGCYEEENVGIVQAISVLRYRWLINFEALVIRGGNLEGVMEIVNEDFEMNLSWER